jgi:hypothetical protein
MKWKLKINKTKKQKKTKLWEENVPKISVEQTKGNGESYHYVYPLGT